MSATLLSNSFMPMHALVHSEFRAVDGKRGYWLGTEAAYENGERGKSEKVDDFAESHIFCGRLVRDEKR